MVDTTNASNTKIGDLASRFAGKKFAAVLIGIGAIVFMLEQYRGLAGAQYDLAQVADLVKAAMYSIAVCVAGGAIGQGIADHGKHRRPPA